MFNKFKRVYRAKRLLKRIILLLVFAIFLVALIVEIIIDKTKDNSNFINGKTEQKETIVEIKRPEITPLNDDGSVNGLNLLLIAQMSEGYCKEYLTICKDSEDGKLTPDCDYKSTVSRILGVAANEQNCYPESNGMILGSPLPWDSSINGPKWSKGDKITLSDVGSTSYNSGRLTATQQFAYAGAYISVFQLAPGFFSNPQHKSSYNPTDGSQHDSMDSLYFPDEVAALNWARKEKYDIIKSITDDSLTSEASELATSMCYSGQNITSQTYIPHNDSADFSKALNDLAEFASKLKNDYGEIYTDNGFESEMGKWIITAMVAAEGGSISQYAYDKIVSNSFQSKSVELFLQHFGLGSDASGFLSSHIDSSIPYMGGATGEVTVTLNGRTFMLTPEAFSHYIGEEEMGPIMYARMLQIGGVAGVDPTNPATYMNVISGTGEWTPSGETDWLAELGIDVSKLGPNRVKLLNTAHTQLGVPYVWGGTAWGQGMDCSGFVQQSILQAFGITIGRTTINQEVDPNFTTISFDDALPGDICLYGTPGASHHVVFFLKDNGDGTIIAMHEPQTGDVCKIGLYHKSGLCSVRRFNQLEGASP